LHEEVGYEGDKIFDNIVSPFLEGRTIDFCSIDIDGNDVEVFETFEDNLPTVICIESGFVLPPYFEKVAPLVCQNNMHQSVNVTINEFEKKGYKVLCTGKNCFFVKEEYYHLFDVSDDLLTLYFNGLRKFLKYIPAIWRKLKNRDDYDKHKNPIALEIMERADYDIKKDTVHRRKVWAKKSKDTIISIINDIEKREKSVRRL
jgi:hypothetical protein